MAVKCPTCGWRFRDQAAVQRHAESHHGAAGPVTSEPPPPASSSGEAPVPVRTGPEWKPKEHVSGLRLGLSYAAALFLPIVGFVLGLFLLRRTIGHGVAVVLISVAVVVASFTIAVDDDSGGAPSSSPRLERLERRLVHIPNRCLKGQSAHDMLRCVQRPNR
jgi:hypothetical protein